MTFQKNWKNVIFSYFFAPATPGWEGPLGGAGATRGAEGTRRTMISPERDEKNLWRPKNWPIDVTFDALSIGDNHFYRKIRVQSIFEKTRFLEEKEERRKKEEHNGKTRSHMRGKFTVSFRKPNFQSL